MPSNDFSTENKICIRNYYNKLIIKYIKEKFGYEVVYFGLPSPDAHDIECWLEYIDYVVAFQCRDHRRPSSSDQSTEEVEKLIGKLNTLEERAQIRGYTVYDGYMEEVVFRGYDNSMTAQPFRYDRCITVFNLDFCNQITSPHKYFDKNGQEFSKHKFELIDKILEFQNNVSECNQKFVLFLTVNGSYEGQELNPFVTANQREIKAFNHLPVTLKKHKTLRLFVEDSLFRTITAKGFIPQFMPTISYNGINNIPMFQFAVMCIKPNATCAGVPTPFQSSDDVKKRKAVAPNDNHTGFDMRTFDGVDETNVDTNFMNEFCESTNFKKYWIQYE